MKLQAASRTYIKWPVNGLPDDSQVMRARVDGSEEWWPLEYITEGTTITGVQLLVAGPKFVPALGDTTVYVPLTVGPHTVEFRFTDAPETVISSGGTIEVVDVAPPQQLTWGVTVSEVANLAPNVPIANGTSAPVGVFAGSSAKISSADVARWIVDVSAMVDARLMARSALTDSVREVVHSAAHAAVVVGAASYLVSAAFPMKSGVNDQSSYSAELWNRYDAYLVSLELQLDRWLGETGGGGLPGAAIGGGFSGKFPPPSFLDPVRW